MIIKSIELETVCGITSKLPDNKLPEIAFAGKSNVGKSSLINALINRKAFARTSQEPGKTQTINFYNINDTLNNPITLNDNNVMVATIGENIVVKNANLGSNVIVYAADGRIISSEVATDGDVVAEAPAKGIYIVAIDGKSFKVMVK